ncbi:I66 family serine proteinase inhibitor [Streptomyces sp. enrichment culture]|uniref:I66 family serine proteinase inhibitor n=1 Tax=Streptomyces sp. enrichment culture TaxID=1795815 RepID=UPI003F57E002
MSILDVFGDAAVRISFEGGGVTDIDGKAFAVVTPEPSAGSWKLVPDERTGKNHFVIVDANEGFMKGLKLAESEDDTQVEVGLIPVGRSLPPFYPAAAVWVIEEAGDEESYTMRSLAADKPIGRRAAEDRTLNPKPIVLNPQPATPEKLLARIVRAEG